MTDERIDQLKRHAERYALEPGYTAVAIECRELFELIAEVERLRGELAARDACWHCKVCLVPQVPRCEMCPSECDDENCQAEGCQR